MYKWCLVDDVLLAEEKFTSVYGDMLPTVDMITKCIGYELFLILNKLPLQGTVGTFWNAFQVTVSV